MSAAIRLKQLANQVNKTAEYPPKQLANQVNKTAEYPPKTAC